MSHIDELRKSGLELKKLLLIGEFCEVGLLSLNRLLLGFHSCLEELHLPVSQYDIEDDRVILKSLGIPRMETLKKLKVVDWNLVGSNGLALNLPALETLNIEVPGTINLEKYYDSFPVKSDSQSTIKLKTHTLSELNLPKIIITPTELQKILLRFPMLEKLTLRINEESAHILWENGSCLKSLTIDYFSKLNDSSITGIPINPDNINIIHDDMMLWDSDDSNSACTNNLRTKKFIGDLKNLQYLKIEKFYGELTDISAIFGIARLTKLTSLSLNSAQITDLSLSVLMKKLNLFHLVLNWSPDEPIFVSCDNLEKLKLSHPYLNLEYSPDRSHFITSYGRVGQLLADSYKIVKKDPLGTVDE